MASAVAWKSPAFIGGLRLSFVDHRPSGVCVALMARTTASVYALRGTSFNAASNSSHARPAIDTTLRSMARSGVSVIEDGSCAISCGAAIPRLRATAAAADGRSCEWQELQPAMRMKLYLCFSNSTIAFSTAWDGASGVDGEA